MAFEQPSFRDAVRPQDAFAALIMLLGLAIALFLEGSAIKLIGGSIGLLGGVALYMTITQRINDQIQLRNRRSTLPPPSFKTRVTQDPDSGTKRIRFDDFPGEFGSDDESSPDESPASERPVAGRQWSADVPEHGADTAEGFRVVSVGEARAATGDAVDHTERNGAAASHREAATSVGSAVPTDRQTDGGDWAGEQAETDQRFAGEDEGSFRIVRAPNRDKKPLPSRSPDRNGEPSGRAVQVRSGGDLAARPAPSGTTAAAQPPSNRTSDAAESSGGRAKAAPGDPEPLAEQPPAVRHKLQAILEDLVSDGEDEVRAGEPRAEFVRLVAQVLNAIARSMSARSILFCWVNLEKGHLIPEARITSGTAEVRLGARIPLSNDVVSQIARSAAPEILTDISPAAEGELIPYYAAPTPTRSFVGVPVFFRREVVGVLAADSGETGEFDETTVAVLAEYTRLISGLIRGYTEKYDLQLNARTLDAFARLHRTLTGAAMSSIDVARTLSEQIAQLIDHRYVAAVLYDAERGRWTAIAEADPDLREALETLELDMDNSLVGYSTRFAEEITLESVGTDVRLAKAESAVLGSGGAFVAIPLVATTKCYGALVVEHEADAAFIPRDIELMRDLSRYASLAIEVFNINRAIENQSVLDEVSGLYNTEFLLSMLDREILRARDTKSPLSFVLISIDIPESLGIGRSSEVEEYIVASVGTTVAESVRPYDVVGRYDARTFGVVLSARNDQDAFLWAERLRKDMAGRILAAGGRKFSVTISAGVCDMSESASSGMIIKGATQALEKAQTGEGNAVILY